MNFKKNPKEAFVWAWLPGETSPVVTGKLTREGEILLFNYGSSYLKRENAISLYDRELPLRRGIIEPLPGLSMPGCIRDASPDAWGRRVLVNKLLGKTGKWAETEDLSELTYLLESGPDRVGALDFQASATEYAPRESHAATLDELLNMAEKVEKGIPLSRELDQAFLHGTSIGGARPKAAVDGEEVKYIAKFSSTTDEYSLVKAEYIAMRLAELCGISVAPVHLKQVSGKEVILVERFDRVHTDMGWQRRFVLSALTLFGLSEMTARYASYEELAEMVRHRFTKPKDTLRELFSRMVFNILCGNTDDHARNHAAFWDGTGLTLTPAYDICPYVQSGSEASQGMLIHKRSRLSRVSLCLEASYNFLLPPEEAISIIEDQIEIIARHWMELCEEAKLTEVDRNRLWGRAFLRPAAFFNLEDRGAALSQMADEARRIAVK